MGEQRSRRERWGHSTPGAAKGKGGERLRVALLLESGLRVRNRAETQGLNSLPDKGALGVTEKGKTVAGKASQWDHLSLSSTGSAGPQLYPHRGTGGMAAALRCRRGGDLSPSWD